MRPVPGARRSTTSVTVSHNSVGFANHGDTSTDYSDRNKSCSDGVGYRTTMVGQLMQPNSFGLYDMHGNLWEWVQDCWNDSYAWKHRLTAVLGQVATVACVVIRGGSFLANVVLRAH